MQPPADLTKRDRILPSRLGGQSTPRRVDNLRSSSDDSGTPIPYLLEALRAESPKNRRKPERLSKRQFLNGREMVLFATNFPVVFRRHLEQLKPSVCRQRMALLANVFHFGFREGFEVHGNRQILIQHLHGIDAADRGGHWEAHGIAQSLLCGDAAMPHHFSTSAKALHAQGGNAAA